MKLVADTSAFLAVVLDEPERQSIIDAAQGCQLVAPATLPFELGNALIAMMKRRLLDPKTALAAWDASQAIAIELRPINIRSALKIAGQYGICAYDAYFLECALSLRLSLLTLDRGLKQVARTMKIELVEFDR